MKYVLLAVVNRIFNIPNKFIKHKYIFLYPLFRLTLTLSDPFIIYLWFWRNWHYTKENLFPSLRHTLSLLQSIQKYHFFTFKDGEMQQKSIELHLMKEENYNDRNFNSRSDSYS